MPGNACIGLSLEAGILSWMLGSMWGGVRMLVKGGWWVAGIFIIVIILLLQIITLLVVIEV